jgi:hypothetical protein
MRVRSLLPVLACVLSACRVSPAPAAPTAAAPAAKLASAEAPTALSGTVVERIDAASYSYLRLKTANGEQWAAVPKTGRAVGDTVAVVSPVWMKDFKSNVLGRTWPEIAFGTLDEAAVAASPHGRKPAAEVGDVRVAKVEGGRTVAEIHEQSAALKDQPIAVRGKVVKATDGVLGKSWLHLRDGSGAGATADLTVASAESAAVGDTVVARGVVRLDRDLGSGYHFDVLIEDAHVTKE